MSDVALPRNGVPGLPLGGRLLGDERLAKLADRGNQQAFAALYERHHQAIYRYCRSILRNDQDAQDAVQSAMMRAYAALGSQERELAVKPWLFRIAHNESISLLRKRRPQEELGDTYEQPGSAIEGTLETRERLTTLLADLQALPERQRGALLMRELSGLSIEQIADALGMSPGAAKQALFEARSSLHELSEGRAMPCESVRKAISQRDGRVLRSRRIRSHLRACEECREFRAAIGTRTADLAALAPPLPAWAASALLARLLSHAGGHSSGGAAVAGSGAASAGATLGSHAATASLLGKGLASVAAVAVAAVGTAHFALSSSNHRKSPRAASAAASSARASRPTGAGAASASGAASYRTSRGSGRTGPTAHNPTARSTASPRTPLGAPEAVRHADARGSGASSRSAPNAGRSQGNIHGARMNAGSHPGSASHRAGHPGRHRNGSQGTRSRSRSGNSGGRSGRSRPSRAEQGRAAPVKQKPTPTSTANRSQSPSTASGEPKRSPERREVLSK